MSRIYTRVNRVADWAGWCSPCEREDRPLVLTRSGPGGVGAWLAGLGDDDRLLLLTCRVCGNWQFVPAREEDDPEVIVVEDDVLESVAEMLSAASYDVRSTGRAVELNVPVPPRLRTVAEQNAAAAAEVAQAAVEPITVDSLIATFGDVPTGHEPVALATPEHDPYVQETAPVEAPVEAAVEAPVEAPAVVPAPRVAVERIVTVPAAESDTPAFSQEVVAAAAAVLSAARAQTAEPADRRSETMDRRHRARRGPTPRRSSDRVAAVRAAAAAEAAARAGEAAQVVVAPPSELAPVLGVPAGTRQVVLAAAS